MKAVSSRQVAATPKRAAISAEAAAAKARAKSGSLLSLSSARLAAA